MFEKKKKKGKKKTHLYLWRFGHHWWEQHIRAGQVGSCLPPELTSGPEEELALGQLAGGCVEGQRGRTGKGFWHGSVGRELWPCRKPSEVASLESSTFLWGRCRETLEDKSHICSVPSQPRHRHLAGLGTSVAQLSIGAWLSRVEAKLHAPPPQLPAGGQAGLPQAWPRCRNFFPLAPGLLPIERKEMRPFQRWHRVLVAENCSCFSTSHTRSGIEGTKMPWRSCYTKGNALCLAFGVLVAKTARSQGGDVSKEEW